MKNSICDAFEVYMQQFFELFDRAHFLQSLHKEIDRIRLD